jgi:hypothetical protein
VVQAVAKLGSRLHDAFTVIEGRTSTHKQPTLTRREVASDEVVARRIESRQEVCVGRSVARGAAPGVRWGGRWAANASVPCGRLFLPGSPEWLDWRD